MNMNKVINWILFVTCFLTICTLVFGIYALGVTVGRQEVIDGYEKIIAQYAERLEQSKAIKGSFSLPKAENVLSFTGTYGIAGDNADRPLSVFMKDHLAMQESILNAIWEKQKQIESDDWESGFKAAGGKIEHFKTKVKQEENGWITIGFADADDGDITAKDTVQYSVTKPLPEGTMTEVWTKQK